MTLNLTKIDDYLIKINQNRATVDKAQVSSSSDVWVRSSEHWAGLR